jgi:phosphatidylglycerophosphatase A
VNIQRHIIIALSSFFYVGYLPYIPGTFASVAAVAVYLILRHNPLLFWLFTVGILLAGFLSAGSAERIFGVKDSPHIVIDEVSGMSMCLVAIPYDRRFVLIAFLVFRILDALKPYPISKLQHLKEGLGVMMDDVLASVYTIIILQVVLKLASVKIS